MELKIMEWYHPLSYFQWSASLWSSFEFRKFSTSLQKQNSYLPSHAPFPTYLCNENSNTSLTHNPLLISLAVLLEPPSALTAYYPKWAMRTSSFQMLSPSPTPLPSTETHPPLQTPTSHKALLFLRAPHIMPHCPPLSLAWISFPCFLLLLLVSFHLTHISHLPHHPSFLNLFSKVVCGASPTSFHLGFVSYHSPDNLLHLCL